MRFDIITIFPDIFDSYLGESLVRRAREKKIIDVRVHNLRDYAPIKRGKASREPRRTVDDRPFGGGPGMVLQVEPIYRAVDAIRAKFGRKKSRVILFSTRGKKLDAKTAKRLSKYDDLVLICGRYEGVDERVAEHIADEEISIGDYVLAGGELPALVLIEAVSRHLPGFLGKNESLEEVNGSFPTFSKPAVFAPKGSKKNWAVPKVLLSGNHKKIEEWRKKNG